MFMRTSICSPPYSQCNEKKKKIMNKKHAEQQCRFCVNNVCAVYKYNVFCCSFEHSQYHHHIIHMLFSLYCSQPPVPKNTKQKENITEPKQHKNIRQTSQPADVLWK